MFFLKNIFIERFGKILVYNDPSANCNNYNWKSVLFLYDQFQQEKATSKLII